MPWEKIHEYLLVAFPQSIYPGWNFNKHYVCYLFLSLDTSHSDKQDVVTDFSENSRMIHGYLKFLGT